MIARLTTMKSILMQIVWIERIRNQRKIPHMKVVSHLEIACELKKSCSFLFQWITWALIHLTRTCRHQCFENTTLEEKFGNFPETTIDLGTITHTNTHLSVRLKKDGKVLNIHVFPYNLHLNLNFCAKILCASRLFGVPHTIQSRRSAKCYIKFT